MTYVLEHGHANIKPLMFEKSLLMVLLDLSAFKRAIDAFERTYDAVNNNKTIQSLSPELQETIRAGVIQNFEFTYEVAWKFIKRWLEKNYGGSEVDGVTRRELFRMAAENKLIDDVDSWMLFHRAGNQTSYTYAIAAEIHTISLQFFPIAVKLYQQLCDKND